MLNLSLCWEKDDKINKKRPGFGPFKNVFAICGILCFKSHLFKSFDLHPSFVSYSFCSLLYTFSPRIFHSYFVGLNFLFILLPIDASPINYNLFINLPYFLSLLLSLSHTHTNTQPRLSHTHLLSLMLSLSLFLANTLIHTISLAIAKIHSPNRPWLLHSASFLSLQQKHFSRLPVNKKSVLMEHRFLMQAPSHTSKAGKKWTSDSQLTTDCSNGLNEQITLTY